MELVDKSILKQVTEFEYIIKSIKHPNGINQYIVKMDKDDYGDCIKNDWTVIGVTDNGDVYQIRDLENKLPTYTYNYDLMSLVEKIILDNEKDL